MPDYYIRTPDHESSRGPFDIEKLLTLAEASQVNENTLYYDEEKEEWIPFALNPELFAQIFPKREKLSLKTVNAQDAAATEDDERDASGGEGIDVEHMLAAAEGVTEETKHLKKRAKSFDKAASLATNGIGIAFLLSAFSLIFPQFEIIKLLYEEGTYTQILNHPFLIVGIFDLFMALFLFLAITEIFPLLRTRGMLTLGFGLYVGWAVGDPTIMLASAVGGFGIFFATIAQSYSTMIIALVCSILGNGSLAFLAFQGRFAGFFDLAKLSIIQAN